MKYVPHIQAMIFLDTLIRSTRTGFDSVFKNKTGDFKNFILFTFKIIKSKEKTQFGYDSSVRKKLMGIF